MNNTVDVIVIGAGFAGLTAAIEAKLDGLDVIVLEKMATIGGNSVISDGGIAAPNTKMQKKRKIKDSTELMKNDILKAGSYLNNQRLVDILVDQAHDAFIWTKKFLGVEYMDRVDIFGGHSVPRCYTPINRTGRELIKALEKKCVSLGIDIKTKTYVKDFITSDNKFLGVEIVADYQYPQKNIVRTDKLYANEGIILATGGYGQNKSMLKRYKKEYAELGSTNKPSATNDLLEKLLAYPIKMIDLEEIQLLPSTSIDENGYGEGALFGDYVVFPYGILIDSREYQRFTNELTDRGSLSNRMITREPFVYGIADQLAVEKADWDLSRALKKGVVKKASSLEDLAYELGCNLDTIKKTLDTYNEAIDLGRDEAFEKTLIDQGKIMNPPYYVMKMRPKIHHTMGGVAINEYGQVMDTYNNVVKGLYAVGETTGGIHGATRLGSMAVTECIVFGRIVGQQVGHS